MPRRPRGCARFLSLALVAMTLAARPSGAAPLAGNCASPATVPGIGRACLEGNLWRIRLPDGSSYLTHGQDDVLPAHPFAQSGGVMPSCASDQNTESYNILVYAHASDQANLYTAHLAPLREAAAEANAALRAEAALFNRTIDYRFLCGGSPKVLVVEDAPLAIPQNDVTLDTLISSLRGLGFTSSMAKYWVYYDGHPPGTQAGVGTLENDDRLAADNASNFGPSYGVTWGADTNGNISAAVMMHESAHTMGAVQNTAPHATGAGHCTDGFDLMCYADGGPSASNYNEKTCAAVRFDCNHDDYFNPVPGAKNYLATHWNLASPLNRFIAGCTYQDGLLAAGGPESNGVTSATVSIPSACQGRAFAVTAVLPQPAGVAPAVASAIAGAPVPDVNVCWYAGSSLVRCDTNLGAEYGVVPQNATSAHVVLATGAAAAWVLSVI